MFYASASIKRAISFLINVFFLYTNVILLIELKKNKIEVILKKSLKNAKYTKKLLSEILNLKNKNVVNRQRAKKSSKKL